MPQATNEDRAKAVKLWGSIDCDRPVQFLEGRGWKLRKDWFWEKPSPSYEPSKEEFFAVDFLIDEWDFGGIVKGEAKGD